MSPLFFLHAATIENQVVPYVCTGDTNTRIDAEDVRRDEPGQYKRWVFCLPRWEKLIARMEEHFIAGMEEDLLEFQRRILCMQKILLDSQRKQQSELEKRASVHHPLLQMLLFARKRSVDIFACLRSITPKRNFGIAKKFLFSASPNAYKAGWISAKLKSEAPNAGPVSEYSTRKSFGRRNHLNENESQHYSDPDSYGAEHGIMAVNTKTSASWIVATAAPHHATGNRDLLSGFITEHDDQFVHAVDGVPMKVLARGAVVTDTVVLPDVWFVPGLTANLVSVSQLAELDYSVGFDCGECSIRSASGGKTVGKAHLREGGQYALDFLKVPLAI